MKNTMSFLIGAIIGGLVGGGLILLFTPYSGEDFRIEITNYTQKVSDEVRSAAQQKREELETQLTKLRQPASPIE